MTNLAFPAAPVPMLKTDDDALRIPVRRVFCVGRNYAAHAAEMGSEVDREAPVYFTKSSLHVSGPGAVAYSPGTEDYHHEIELAFVIGSPAFRVDTRAAARVVFGYACALDMTRRDLQAAAKVGRKPWDTGKDVEGSCIVGPVKVAADFSPGDQEIVLSVDGDLRQKGRLSDMVHSVPEIVADLSRLYHLDAGDVILTGTPAGVGPIEPGAILTAEIDGLAPLEVTVVPAER